MAIAYDARGSATVAYSSGTSASPATWSHTNAANAYVLVWCTSNGGTATNWTATYNGVAMTAIGVGPSFGSRLFGLYVASAGTYTVSVTHDRAASPFYGNSVSYTGVSSSSPYSNFTQGTAGTGSNPTVTVTSAVGNVVVDFLFSRAGITAVNQTTTERSQFDNGNAGQAIGEKAGAASTSMGWTVNASGDSNYDVGVSLNAAVGPSISAQPTAQTARLNGDTTATATFSITASGTGSLTYDWELETSVGSGTFANLADGSGATWTGQATATAVGTFTAKTVSGRKVRCNVTDDNGTTTSAEVVLTVLDGPVLSAASATTNGSGVASVTMVTDDALTANGELLLVTATGRGGAVLGRTTLRPQDFSAATLTSSTFALTADGVATTTLTGDVGVAASGIPVNFTVQRIQMNAADSFVSADPTDIASDGVETSTITVQALYREDGAEDYIPLPGIPAASVVLAAATTTGNTLTQPATATDANGVTTGTLKTTDAAATKTVSATIAGLAVTDTATVTTDGGYVPPAPGTPFFEDDFAGTQRNNANGFTWSSTGGRTTVQSFDGYNALRFRYGPDASGADSAAEQRFDLGQYLDHMWVEYDVYIPSNFVHRNDVPQNNKWFLLWRDIYSDANTWRFGWEYTTDSSATPDSTIRGYSSRWDFNYQTDTGPNYSPTGQYSTFISPTGPLIPGQWNQVRIEVAAASNSTASDGIQRMWINGTLYFSITTGRFWNYATGSEPVDCYFRNGYFMGWANSGFTDETDVYIKAVKFYNSDPAW